MNPPIPPPDDPSADRRPGGSLSVEQLDAAVELMGRSGRRGRVRVRGSSMLPTLRPGDELAVEFATGRPRFGELIVFRQQGALLVHRALGRARRGGWRSRGDGVLSFDPAVSEERLVGRVVAAELDGRWVSFDGPGARWWGRALALHDLVWGGLAVAARPLDRLADALGAERPARRAVAAANHHLLGIVHRLGFAAAHRTLERPPD